MCNEITKTPSDFISITDNALTTTSLVIAEVFNKKHYDVLKKIKSLDCSPEFGDGNFTATSYTDQQGKEKPSYQITRDGFIMLVMGFTGEKAMAVKEAFIIAFSKMEQRLYGLPVIENKPLSAQRKKQQKEEQVREIEERLHRLLGLFNQLSPQFNDVMGISLALRGKHPTARLDMEGYVKVLPDDRGMRRRVNY